MPSQSILSIYHLPLYIFPHKPKRFTKKQARMANSASVRSENFHLRSISLPSRSHPLVFKIEEEVQKLKISAVTSAAAMKSSMTMKNACSDLLGLGDLYRRIDEILHLPSILQAFSYPNEKKWLEKELEVSVRLLDLCGAAKENMATVDEHVQQLHSAIRRRGDSASEEFVLAQVCSKKETRNSIKKCQNLLKKVVGIHRSCPPIDKTSDISLVAKVLIEARDLTISLLSSMLSFLSMSRPKEKTQGWSFVSKVINLRKVACNGKQEDGSYNSYCFEDVEAGLECLFRRLIQNRVSLLNILSI